MDANKLDSSSPVQLSMYLSVCTNSPSMIWMTNNLHRTLSLLCRERMLYFANVVYRIHTNLSFSAIFRANLLVRSIYTTGWTKISLNSISPRIIQITLSREQNVLNKTLCFDWCTDFWPKIGPIRTVDIFLTFSWSGKVWHFKGRHFQTWKNMEMKRIKSSIIFCTDARLSDRILSYLFWSCFIS